MNTHATQTMSEGPRATPACGNLIGLWTDTEHNYALFAGIPFAKPPIGALRWAAPQPAEAWTGDRRAVAFGPQCPQLTPSDGTYLEAIVRGQGFDAETTKHKLAELAALPRPSMSEDCLYLNVRTANLDGAREQPVLVWIHGGSHQTGSACADSYQTNGLLRHGVVVVSVNYRLNAFGYFSHPSLSAATPWKASGNYGLQDIIFALEWVRDNIEAFGGDPNNVTLFGVSAGAQSISQIMASPFAAGLFHKAILQSGVYSYDFAGVDDTIGARFVERAGLCAADASAETLKSLPVDALLTALRDAPPEHGAFMPGADGHFLPHNVCRAIHDGRIAAVPVLAGYNADEGTLLYPYFPGPALSLCNRERALPERLALFRETFGQDADRLIDMYKLSDAETWRAGETAMLGDDMFGVHTRFLAKTCVAHGTPVYLYHFSRRPPNAQESAGAYHGAEITFVFDSHRSIFATVDADHILTDAIGRYWTNFAKFGDPNAPGLPPWPAYDANDAWLILDHHIRSEKGVRADKLDLLERNLIRTIEAATSPLSTQRSA